ncbi:NFX1-type zinc finger-containing protein 1-like isoform X2 [Daktulosphaira vitifoliae]|uniref:NFX1-type zinc finger-containing protein 1-like isoform X2 n=1 Tax=Daktulosphaira vitifoliae TaxID=58002 RepID=UPI0021A9CDEA|nr:NFX1-type zinc finger-containing protein 1-like isoform X2 [Daktulosphaira vitifoliae]
MGGLPEEFFKSFRSHTIYPTVNDIDFVNSLPYNLDKGPYKSEEHYLDTQFKLLREDFIYPLRKAVQYYRKNKNADGTHLVVNNVHFDGSREFVGNKLGLIFKFDPTHFNVNLFINGFLLLFSKDDFNTFYTGLVLKDDKDNLNSGILHVEMLSELDIIPNTTFLMAQYEQFYVPYNWTLKGIQQMNTQQFPMKEYIVEAKNIPSTPKYLRDSNFQIYDLDDYRFNILKDEEWPSEVYLQQESTQFNAFKAALTEECVLIQGASGTGKTFIGQRIVKTLIENLYVNSRLKNPIAIICNNNLTLDHFLKGILKLSDKLIRIGSQSKHNILKKHSLKEIVKLHNLKIDNELESCIKSKEEDILKYYKKCDQLYEGILDWNILKQVIPEVSSTTFTDSWDFLNWLFHPFSVDKIMKKNSFNYQYDQHCLKPNDIKQCLLELTEEVTNGTMLTFNYLHLQNDQIYVDDLHLVPANQRWTLYYHWIQRIVKTYKNMINKIWIEYIELYKRLDKNRLTQTMDIFEGIYVIGLTTTGAVKNKDLLEYLKPPIVIMEEGAETLEPFIVAALTEHVQHLIIIGDLKPERPKLSSYSLAKGYNFNQTLIDRLINNGMPLYQLTKQFRMRPEILSIVLPCFNQKLKNSELTKNLPSVNGISKNVFFLDHNCIKEYDFSNNTNLHEANFLISLARYLRLQNYKSEDILILTSHKNQVLLMNKLKEESSLVSDINVSLVDNCAINECEIVLLSTIYNKQDSCYWKHENRIYSSLTRAKIGLYIIGNINNLITQNDLWSSIYSSLKNQNSYGSDLTLECSIHYGTFSKVTTHEDFVTNKCKKPCLHQLKCKHYCLSSCHVRDRDHSYIFKCKNINCRTSKSLIRYPLRDILLLLWEYSKNIIYEIISQPI